MPAKKRSSSTVVEKLRKKIGDGGKNSTKNSGVKKSTKTKKDLQNEKTATNKKITTKAKKTPNRTRDILKKKSEDVTFNSMIFNNNFKNPHQMNEDSMILNDIAYPSSRVNKKICRNVNITRFGKNFDDMSSKYYSNSVINGNMKVECYFSQCRLDKDGKVYNTLKKNIIDHIYRYGKNSIILGCVAWIFDQDVLDILGYCKQTLFVVNSEYFDKHKSNITISYSELPKFKKPFLEEFKHIDKLKKIEEDLTKNNIKKKYVNCPSTKTSVLKIGHPSLTSTSGPNNNGLEHCKYLIFFKEMNGNFYPDHIVTGSMNFTKGSEKSHENMVCIYNEDVAERYLLDFYATMRVALKF